MNYDYSTLNLFDGVEPEIVAKAMKNIKNNLKVVINEGMGHLYKHLYKDDLFLQNRIISEKKESATCFYEMDVKQILGICEETMCHNWWRIKSFLTSEEERLVLDWDFDKPLGYGYQKGFQGVFEDLHKVRMVIIKNNKYNFGFFIMTIHPLITDDIIPDESVEWAYA